MVIYCSSRNDKILTVYYTYLYNVYSGTGLRDPETRIATTRPYIAIIPAIMTGIIDFIISSGLITDIAAIPVPDFAVP